jgi:hypothetical protein
MLRARILGFLIPSSLALAACGGGDIDRAPATDDEGASEGALTSKDPFDPASCAGPRANTSDFQALLEDRWGPDDFVLGKYKLAVRERKCAGTACGAWSTPPSIDLKSWGGTVAAPSEDTFEFPVPEAKDFGEFTATLHMSAHYLQDDGSYRRFPFFTFASTNQGVWTSIRPHGLQPHIAARGDRAPIELHCENETEPMKTNQSIANCHVFTYDANDPGSLRSVYVETFAREWAGMIGKNCFRYAGTGSRQDGPDRYDMEFVFYGKYTIPQPKKR